MVALFLPFRRHEYREAWTVLVIPAMGIDPKGRVFERRRQRLPRRRDFPRHHGEL